MASTSWRSGTASRRCLATGAPFAACFEIHSARKATRQCGPPAGTRHRLQPLPRLRQRPAPLPSALKPSARQASRQIPYNDNPTCWRSGTASSRCRSEATRASCAAAERLEAFAAARASARSLAIVASRSHSFCSSTPNSSLSEVTWGQSKRKNPIQICFPGALPLATARHACRTRTPCG